eukprot:1397951-Pleurochrysis_carterae.AAC.4
MACLSAKLVAGAVIRLLSPWLSVSWQRYHFPSNDSVRSDSDCAWNRDSAWAFRAALIDINILPLSCQELSEVCLTALSQSSTAYWQFWRFFAPYPTKLLYKTCEEGSHHRAN